MCNIFVQSRTNLYLDQKKIPITSSHRISFMMPWLPRRQGKAHAACCAAPLHATGGVKNVKNVTNVAWIPLLN